MYINVHTHILTDSNAIVIHNLDVRENHGIEGFYSIGIHPWWINDVDVESVFERMEKCAEDEYCLAFGEIGLDRLCPIAFDLQEKVFEKQFDLAREHAMPVIIHAVRTHHNILAKYDSENFEFPLIFHGFNNNMNIAAPLIEAGFYFSLGSALLREDSNAQHVLKHIGLNRLFFENDQQDIPIEQIYEKATKLLNISEKELRDAVQDNFEKVFVK